MHVFPHECPAPLVVLCPPEHFEECVSPTSPAPFSLLPLRDCLRQPHAVAFIEPESPSARTPGRRSCVDRSIDSSPSRYHLVDERGQALDPRLTRVLIALADRFRREFPVYRDDESLTEALEAAARKIQRRERLRGAIAQLDRYAWITLKHVAISTARLTRRRLWAQTVPSDAGAIALASLQAQTGTAEQIEGGILLAQLLPRLTPLERTMCRLRAEGYTSAEIADQLGTSPGAVDVAFVRLRRKVRRLIDRPPRRPATARARRSFSR